MLVESRIQKSRESRRDETLILSVNSDKLNVIGSINKLVGIKIENLALPKFVKV